MAKLFNLTKSSKDGCEASRCKNVDDIKEVSGEFWARTKVKLCPRHITELETFKKENPDYKPSEPGTELTVVDPSLDQELQEKAKEAQEVLETLKDYAPQTQEDLEDVRDWLKDAKVRRNWLETREKEITGPMRTAENRVRDLFRPAKQFWADVEMLLKAKIASVRLLEERRNQEALAAAAEAHGAGDQEGTQEALAQVTTVSDLQGISTQVKWKYEVVNAAEVPREYLKVDDAKLKAYCGKFKGDQKPNPIPGIKFIENVVVSARTAS